MSGIDRLGAAAASGHIDPLWLAELQRRYVTSGGPPPPASHIAGIFPPHPANVPPDILQREQRERIGNYVNSCCSGGGGGGGCRSGGSGSGGSGGRSSSSCCCCCSSSSSRSCCSSGSGGSGGRSSSSSCCCCCSSLFSDTKHEPYLPLLPVAEHHRPLAGTHYTYPRRDGQAELT